MKLLLDENLPQQLRQEIVGHDCYTVVYMGWGGVDNGELLSRAAGAGFDALITKDAKPAIPAELGVRAPGGCYSLRTGRMTSTIFARSSRPC